MCPIVGANWNNGSIAGVWALNLNNVRANANNNVGGRADSATPRTGQPDGGAKGGAFWRPVTVAKSISSGFSGRAQMGFEGRTR
jgi:hypothetical protein